MEIKEVHKKNFEANLERLGETDPLLFEKLRSLPRLAGFGRDADGRLTAKKGGSCLESRHAPGSAEAALLGAPPEAGTDIVFLGSGLGCHINGLLSARSGGRSFLVERDLELFRASLHFIEPALFPGIVALVGLGPGETDAELRRRLGPRVSIVRHPSSVRLDPGYYSAVERSILRAARSALASGATERAYRRVWVRNILKNASRAGGRWCGTAGFEALFRGPVLLVASGPFLDDAAGDVSALAKCVPLMALLPSFGFLSRHGIAPDLVFSTDGGFWNRLRRAPEARVPLFTTFSAEPALLGAWPSDVFLFSHGLPLEGAFRGLSSAALTVPMQGTAAGAMVRIARTLGFEEIYLAGFDFAYRGMRDHHTGGGFDGHHLASSTRLESWHTRTARGLRMDRVKPVRLESGAAGFSSHKLLLYRDWMDAELGGGDLARLNDGAAMGRVPRAGRLEGRLDVHRARRCREAFLDRLSGLGGDRIPRSTVDADFGRIERALREGEVGRGARSVYRLFFGEPPPGAPEEEIEAEAAWALDAFRARRSPAEGGRSGGA